MFDYDPATTEIRNRRIAPMGSQPVVDQELLSVLLSMDDTVQERGPEVPCAHAVHGLLPGGGQS